jgi:hypothetical protein
LKGGASKGAESTRSQEEDDSIRSDVLGS